LKAVKLLLLAVLLFVFAPLHFSQTAGELHSTVRAAVGEGRYADALSGLKTLEQKYPDLFKTDNYDYLAARVQERAGNSAAAAALYLGVVKRGSILKAYALFHLSAIARASGNLVLERTYLDEIAAFSPESLIADAARNRRARSWFESGNYEMAITALGSLLPSSAKTPGKAEDAIARENRLFLARSYMLSGNTAAARDEFANLISSLANPGRPDDFALAAVKALDKMDLGPGAGDRSVPELGDYEHLRRASIYQFNRDFADARRHYAAIIRDHPASGIVPDAIFQTGRGYAQEANFPEAINWFERTIEQFPEHALSRDALLQAASAYARVSKFHEGVRRYQDFIAKYPNDERLDRAYLNIIDTLRDEGEEIEALKWAAKTQEVFRGKLPEALGLFAEVRIGLARNNWDTALSGLNKLLTVPDLGGAAVPGGTSRAEVTFLRGYVLEQEQNFAEAIDAYLSIPDGRNEYYGGRATERLRELAKNEAAKAAVESKLASLPADSKDLEANRRNLQAAVRLTVDPAELGRRLESLRKIYSNLPAYKNVPSFKLIDVTKAETKSLPAANGRVDPHKDLAECLTRLGLFDEAAPEFEASLKAEPPGASDLAYTIAVLYKRGDRGYRAVAFAEPAWRPVPADYQVELISRDQIELLYPAPYRDAFTEHALPRNVDPRFLLSIVRQESRYRPDVKSYAAARGLMQFISTTSNKIAAELDRKDFDQDELYNPSTATLFGSQYAADLFRLFPNQPEAVAASYNGGEDNVSRWMKRPKSASADRYVPEIAFSQSKDYVYKVMTNYRVYRMFYNEDLSFKQDHRE
jgi:soluble lytic murein transglycosylase